MNKKIAWTLVILWMLLIFFFSSQIATDSNGMSTGITVAIRNLIIQIYPKLSISIETLNHFIRKSAHFLIYFGLGFLLKNAYHMSGYLNIKGSLYAISVSILYAISDEIHQMFVPGRGPGIKDVFIDSLGALTGILFFTVFLMTYEKLKRIID
jgi:VanZ family protein